ncbi:hypothetical protein COCNU_08G008230 [Cocos nucifera]|uniref:Uncharacterized protein n=1 Tax=Cocos nucifera TaxID=13894 RepID=A0A8K0IIQ0_COCNU|nr:hypothetical protein COCNU_08G008230 [Cocos nucifera]
MDIASEKVISLELARESLMAISQCIPDMILPSNLLPEKSAITDVSDRKDCSGAEDYRSKLISISYIQAPDVQPSPPYVENPSS